MVEVRVAGVARDALGQHIILLKPLVDLGEDRVLPIWIGGQEATSILVAVEGASTPRPLSHDLMTTLLAVLGADLRRVEVTRIEGGTFYAELTVRTAAGDHTIDARPSDAIAIASRTHAPIWVADDVLESAGIPGDFVEEAPDGEDGPSDDQKVDEFRRFLDDVDPDDFQG
jgi:uncharacterized protein